jgi:phospholipase D
MPNTRRPNKPKRTVKTVMQKPAIFFALLVGWGCGYEAAVYRYPEEAARSSFQAVIQVRFSPGGQCIQFVEAAIEKAQKSILVQAYSFTSIPIANALIAAHKRGITVSILVDKSQRTSKGTQVHRVAAEGIAVAIDKVPGIAHNKVMIIDDEYVLTGSFNWSKSAETSNAENLLLIEGTKINDIYKDNWHKRAGQSERLGR